MRFSSRLYGCLFLIISSLLRCSFNLTMWLFMPVLELQKQVSSGRYPTRQCACSRMGMQIATSFAALRYCPDSSLRSYSLIFVKSLVQKARRWLVTNGQSLQLFFSIVVIWKAREQPTPPLVERKFEQTNHNFFYWKTALNNFRTCFPKSQSSPSTIKNIYQGLQYSLAAVLKFGMALRCSVFLMIWYLSDGKLCCEIRQSLISPPVPSLELSSMMTIWKLEYSCMSMDLMLLRYLCRSALLQVGTTMQKGNSSYLLMEYFFSQKFFYFRANLYALQGQEYIIYRNCLAKFIWLVVMFAYSPQKLYSFVEGSSETSLKGEIVGQNLREGSFWVYPRDQNWFYVSKVRIGVIWLLYLLSFCNLGLLASVLNVQNFYEGITVVSLSGRMMSWPMGTKGAQLFCGIMYLTYPLFFCVGFSYQVNQTLAQLIFRFILSETGEFFSMFQANPIDFYSCEKVGHAQMLFSCREWVCLSFQRFLENIYLFSMARVIKETAYTMKKAKNMATTVVQTQLKQSPTFLL